jgi:hypothetical protein
LPVRLPGNFYEDNILIPSGLNTFSTSETLSKFDKQWNFMKYLKPIIGAVLLISLGFTSCKKSSTHTKTNTELLTQASWKFSAASAAGYGDVSSSVPDCYKDNIYTFVSDGSGNVNESTNICSPSTAGPFTWSFQNNETTLHISTTLFQNGSSDFTLVSLTETNLVVSQTMTIAPLPPTTVQVTFTH